MRGPASCFPVADLATFLRSERDAIIAEWLVRVRALPAAEGMPEPVLLDNIPQILDELAEALERADADHQALDALPSHHALARYRVGFDVRSVVAEYQLLRRVILERLAAATETLQLHDALDRAIADAVDHFAAERDRAQEIFVGILGHDLRNPLGAIQMAAAQLSRPEVRLEASARRLVGRISNSTARIRRLIEDLLDVTRSRIGGGLPMMPRPMDLREVVTDVVDEFHEAYPDRDVQVESDGPLRGTWDPDRLAQVVSNLVANALEHGTDPVVVSTAREDDAVVLEVRNRGRLFDDEMLHTFDVLASLSAARHGRRGLGLGLYIVREVVRAHGGQMSAESAGDDTTFRIRLPGNAAP